MNSRGVVGAKIVKIQQTRFFDHQTDRWLYAVDAFVLDNGTTVLFKASDDGIEPFVTAFTVSRPG